MGLAGTRTYFFLPPDSFRPPKYPGHRRSPTKRLGAPRSGRHLSVTARSLGVGFSATGNGDLLRGRIGRGWGLGSQLVEPAQKQPFRLDRQQWVCDLEWRARVPDDFDRHGAEE